MMAMEYALDINHLSQGIKSPKVTGMLAEAYLVDDFAVLEDIELPISYAVIIKRINSSYYNIVISADLGLLELISPLMETSSLNLRLKLLGVDGGYYGVSDETVAISDYRTDRGTNSSSVSVTSTAYLADSTGEDVILDAYLSKSEKMSDSVVEYAYALDPTIYRKIGIGRLVIENSLQSKVTSKSLILTDGAGSSLTITSELI